jgi:hypothetical protein
MANEPMYLSDGMDFRHYQQVASHNHIWRFQWIKDLSN